MTANAKVTREDRDGLQEFVLRVDGDRLGSLDFTLPGAGIMRIEYVEVAAQLRGSGLGLELVRAAVNWARESDLRVVPICGYARAVITRDPVMSTLLR